MTNSKIVIYIVVISFFASCTSHKRVIQKRVSSTNTTGVEKKIPVPVTIRKVEAADAVLNDLKRRKPNLNKTTLAYIEEYNDIAILEMISYKIPASITLAQGILESQSGKSRLSVRGNNHFGIKCHNSWKGKRLHHDDDARQECFRKYEHPFSSFRDHSLFLYGKDRYAGLFKLRKKDYKGWAKGLKKAGYATDPKYPKKLITLIEDYELYKYDDFDNDFHYGGQVVKKQDNASYRNAYVLVSKGDTLYSIAKNNNLTVERLKWINGLKSNELSIGQKLYVK
ncbi:MAG TPA: LysM peptidoglycan-binding domain-containing protein [Flavobacteriia bacterium]|nr:LysM peptidoglycan-binding domain-containing protein [Flavobacteriia bacterium]